ncbi:hypothetical protein, partial [Enterococcus faecium]|uniref:hypothetical protein n=1 Tax=Enterococcus faecium TaxID=1352 RepID=UPI0034E97357
VPAPPPNAAPEKTKKATKIHKTSDGPGSSSRGPAAPAKEPLTGEGKSSFDKKKAEEAALLKDYIDAQKTAYLSKSESSMRVKDLIYNLLYNHR